MEALATIRCQVPECDATFTTIKEQLNHLEGFHRACEVACPWCGENFAKVAKFREHALKRHETENIKPSSFTRKACFYLATKPMYYAWCSRPCAMDSNEARVWVRMVMAKCRKEEGPTMEEVRDTWKTAVERSSMRKRKAPLEELPANAVESPWRTPVASPFTPRILQNDTAYSPSNMMHEPYSPGFEEHNGAPEYGPTPILDGPTPILDGLTPILDGPTPILDGPTPILEDPVSCEGKPPLVSEPPQKVVCVMGPPEAPARLPPPLRPEIRAATGPAPAPIPTFVGATAIQGGITAGGMMEEGCLPFLPPARRDFTSKAK